MPSNIANVSEFDRRLEAAIDGVRRVVARDPGFEAMAEIGAQLERLRAATRGGERPAQALRDDLDFGPIASLHAHAIEPALARELYEIASWVVYA